MARTGLTRVCVLAAIGVAAVLVTGCPLNIIEDSIGHTIYLSGAINAVDKHTAQEVLEATKKALQGMDYVVATADRTTLGAVIDARSKWNPEKKAIRIDLTERQEGGTHIRIRVGRTGDKGLSNKLLESIRSQLG